MDPSHTDDPWEWSVDEVVHNFCAQGTIWSQLTARPVVPEPGPLEKALRENAIDGMNLLTNIDNAVLKSELGIAVLGQRGTIMLAIESLRARSKRYQSHIQSMTTQARLYSGIDPGIPFGLHSPAHLSYLSLPVPRLPSTHETPPAQSVNAQVLWQPASTPDTGPHLPYGYGPSLSQLTPTPPRLNHTGHRISKSSKKPSSVVPPSTQQQDSTSRFKPPASSPTRLPSNRSGQEGRNLQSNGQPDHLAESSQASSPVAALCNDDVSSSEIAYGDMSEESRRKRRQPSSPLVSTGNKRQVAPTQRGASHETLTLAETFGHTGRRRSLENFVIDESGRKRRKLTPTPVLDYPVLDSSSALNIQDQTEQVGLPRRKDTTTLATSRKLSSPVVKPHVMEENAKGLYFPPTAFSVDDIFYGGVPFGGQLKNDVEYDHSHGGPNPQHEENFSFVARAPGYLGLRRFVNKAMKRFLLNSDPRVINRDGKQYVIVQPYPVTAAPPGRNPSITVFTVQSPTEVVATREDATRFLDTATASGSALLTTPNWASKPKTLSASRTQDSNDIKDYDYLEKWRYLEGSKLLPPLGESGSEGEYDSDTWREMEEEKGEIATALQRLRKGALSYDEVIAEVDLAIQDLVEKWNRDKRPKREPKAWSIWRSSRRQGTKKLQIRMAQDLVNKINNERLPKMRDEIAKQIWTSASQVRKQCTIMEQSIFEREDLLWKISVLLRRSEPQRPAPQVKKTKLPKAAKSFEPEDEDEELLESESDQDEILDMEDQVDDFMVDGPVTEEADADDELEVDMDIDEDEDNAKDDPAISKPERRKLLDELSPDAQPRNMGQDARQDNSATQSDDEEAIYHPKSTSRVSSPNTFVSATESPEETEQLPIRTTPKTLLQSGGPDVIDLTMTSDASGDDRPRSRFGITTPPTNNSADENPFRDPKASESVEEGEAKQTRSSVGPPIDLEGSDTGGIDDSSGSGELATDGEELGRYSDVETISTRPTKYYEKRRDHKRLLIRLLSLSTTEVREMFTRRVETTSEVDLSVEVWMALEALRDDKRSMPGMDKQTFEDISKLAAAYSTWYEGKYRTGGWPKALIVRIISDRKSFAPFCRFLKQALRGFKDLDHLYTTSPRRSKSERMRLGNAVFEGYDSDDLRTGNVSPNKKRKRKVFENIAARDLRESDRRRLAEQEQRKQDLEQRFKCMGETMNQDPRKIIVNIGKFEDQDPIYLHPRIGRRIKGHQIEGVQFMWREIVMPEKSRSGCLLAHEMGLGKTMQVVAFLVTLAQAAKSPIEGTSSQIPEELKKFRTLVLCPSSLVDNWSDEVLMWAPLNSVGPLRKLDSRILKQEDRLELITDWYEEGGILIVSYNRFRNLIANKARRDKDPPLNEEKHYQIKKQLLQGPKIIVADEAHLMKNPKTGLAAAALEFRSRSRIALTGSPLANSLEEYYNMIDWVAPGYLGPLVEFRAKYVEPIQEGLYQNSTQAEMRKSLKMLHVLKTELGPKVCRADLSVLKGSLTTKTEFVLNVPLTPLQRKAYSLYVQCTLSNDGVNITNTRLWDWLAILSLLCNHPKCFIDKLTEREKQPQKPAKSLTTQKGRTRSQPSLNESATADADDLDLEPGEAPVSALGMSDTLIQRQLALFKKVGEDVNQSVQSHKIHIVEQILDAAAEVGDKSLIFSHRIPTLDFLEKLCKTQKRQYVRLDGKTKMANRQEDVKRFNASGDDIYLVSTRAGGLGLNLPGANRVILMDFCFNPTWEAQAIGRAYRIGQGKPVFVYRFTASGTFEDVIYNKALFKTQLAVRVVDKLNPMRNAQKNVKDYLFEPKDVAQKDLSEFKGKDPLVLDKILAKQAVDKSIRSISLTETFPDDADKLTAEEELEVDQLVKDEQLKRTDPAAYAKMTQERQEKQLRSAMAGIPNAGQDSSSPRSPHLILTGSGPTARPPLPMPYNPPSIGIPPTSASTVALPNSLHRGASPILAAGVGTRDLAPSILPSTYFPPLSPVRQSPSLPESDQSDQSLDITYPELGKSGTQSEALLVADGVSSPANREEHQSDQKNPVDDGMTWEATNNGMELDELKPSDDAALDTANTETFSILSQSGPIQRAEELASEIRTTIKEVAGHSQFLANLSSTNVYLRDYPAVRSRLLNGELSIHQLFGIGIPDSPVSDDQALNKPRVRLHDSESQSRYSLTNVEGPDLASGNTHRVRDSSPVLTGKGEDNAFPEGDHESVKNNNECSYTGADRNGGYPQADEAQSSLEGEEQKTAAQSEELVQGQKNNKPLLSLFTEDRRFSGRPSIMGTQSEPPSPTMSRSPVNRHFARSRSDSSLLLRREGVPGASVVMEANETLGESPDPPAPVIIEGPEPQPH